MPVVYLDTVVHSELDAREQGRTAAQVTEDEARDLWAAIRNGRVLVRTSPVVLDELTGELENDRSAVVRKFRIARDLGNGFHAMLKAPADLMRDAIRAYADGTINPPDILLPEPERAAVVAAVADVCAGSTRRDRELTLITLYVGELKDKWKASMREGQAEVLSKIGWDRRSSEDRRALTFQMFFETGAKSLAEGFAESLGCAEACRRRGLDGLVAVPAVRLCVGVAMSQIYAQVVGEGQGQVRYAHRNDGYDLWHAILGSTAEIFVTFDHRLADHLERIPNLTGFRVVRSVGELLRLIK